MNKTILVLLIFASNFLSAQISDNELKLEQANKLAEENPDGAIDELKQILNDEPDTTKVFARAFFNIAVIYSSKGDVENTKIWYEKVMNSSFNPKDPGPNFLEPYACYQHNAAMQLGIFLYNNQLFNEALEYFVKAKEEYPFLSTSGTSIGKRINAIDIWKSRCYMALGELDETIATLISSSVSCYSPMKSEIDATIEQVIEEYYGAPKFKKTIEKGLKKLTKVGSEYNPIKGEIVIWELPFNNATIKICTENKEESISNILANFKTNSWYK